MFSNNSYLMQQMISLPEGRSGRHHGTNNRALDLFRRASLGARMASAWSLINGRSNRLQDLNDVTAGRTVRSRYYAGIQTVLISRIKGSEGRTSDFDLNFNPLREHTRDRWLSVAQAALQDQPLPPVELIQVGDAYFVRDGHHRISVMRRTGQEAIEAEVTVWELDNLPSMAVCPALGECLPA